MQIAAETTRFLSLPSATLSEYSVTVGRSQLSRYGVIRCNGAVVSLESPAIPLTEIQVFLAVDGTHGAVSAELQRQGIDAGLGSRLYRRGQTRNTLNWDQRMGPIV
jgi:hypothetical protein